MGSNPTGAHLPAEMMGKHNQEGDAPAELSRAEASASDDDRSLTDQRPDNTRDTADEQASLDARPNYSPEARAALGQVFSLILSWSHEDERLTEGQCAAGCEQEGGRYE